MRQCGAAAQQLEEQVAEKSRVKALEDRSRELVRSKRQSVSSRGFVLLFVATLGASIQLVKTVDQAAFLWAFFAVLMVGGVAGSSLRLLVAPSTEHPPRTSVVLGLSARRGGSSRQYRRTGRGALAPGLH